MARSAAHDLLGERYAGGRDLPSTGRALSGYRRCGGEALLGASGKRKQCLDRPVFRQFLSLGDPVFARSDSNVNFNWGTNCPGAGVSPTNFSVKWDSAQSASSATFYTVYVTADDDARVSVDNNLVINQWHDHSPTSLPRPSIFPPGLTNWHVEYLPGTSVRRR